jgi:hypothetical protein
MRHIPEAGAVCGNSARTDLCGGRGVTSVPTATPVCRDAVRTVELERLCQLIAPQQPGQTRAPAGGGGAHRSHFVRRVQNRTTTQSGAGAKAACGFA